jgi:Asp-tRNA(Asn)/Glu-tRNA(Gln) amidotransferase A subunit family amidase
LPFDGVLGQAPSFDTIGWFTREPRLLGAVARVILGGEIERAPLPRRLIVAEDAFALAEPATVSALKPAVARLGELAERSETPALSSVPLAEWLRCQTALQGREAWATFGDWIDRHNPGFGFEVADNFLRGSRVDDATVQAAKAFRAERQAELAHPSARKTNQRPPLARRGASWRRSSARHVEGSRALLAAHKNRCFNSAARPSKSGNNTDSVMPKS